MKTGKQIKNEIKRLRGESIVLEGAIDKSPMHLSVDSLAIALSGVLNKIKILEWVL